MKLLKLLNKYSSGFYLLGQNAINPYNDSLKSWNKKMILSQFIPTGIIIIIICATILFETLFQCLYATYYGLEDMFIFFIFLLSLFMTNIATASQSIFLYTDLHELFCQFDTLEHLSPFKSKLCLCKFVKDYKQKLFIISITYFCSVLVVIVVPSSNVSDLIINMGLYVLMACVLVAEFHALFYITLFNFLLNEFIQYTKIEISQLNVFCTTDIIQSFKLFKQTWFQLWNISITINKYFGWGLLTILLENYICATYTGFWTFMHLMSPATFHLFIRNLVLFFIFL